MPIHLRELTNDYANEWARAEEFVKATEGIENKVHYASVQELRYAGRRFAAAISAGVLLHLDDDAVLHEKTITVHLVEAIENCKKARHDAIDSAIMYIHGSLKIVVDEFTMVKVLQFFPDFVKLADEISIIRSKISKSRRILPDRDETYFDLKENHLEQVKDFYRKLVIADGLLADAKQAEQLERRRGAIARRRAAILSFGSVILLPIVLAGAGIYASIWPESAKALITFLAGL
jgi:hypothetical protein